MRFKEKKSIHKIYSPINISDLVIFSIVIDFLLNDSA
jgi:hypothetical protein